MFLRLLVQLRAVYNAFVSGNNTVLGRRITSLLNTLNQLWRKREANLRSSDQKPKTNSLDRPNSIVKRIRKRIHDRQTKTKTTPSTSTTISESDDPKPHIRLYIPPKEPPESSS